MTFNSIQLKRRSPGNKGSSRRIRGRIWAPQQCRFVALTANEQGWLSSPTSFQRSRSFYGVRLAGCCPEASASHEEPPVFLPGRGHSRLRQRKQGTGNSHRWVCHRLPLIWTSDWVTLADPLHDVSMRGSRRVASQSQSNITEERTNEKRYIITIGRLRLLPKCPKVFLSGGS